MAGRRQGISGISKGSQNILIYNFIITTFGCQGGSQGGSISARAFSRARPGVALPLNQKLQFRQNNTAYYDTFFSQSEIEVLLLRFDHLKIEDQQESKICSLGAYDAPPNP